MEYNYSLQRDKAQPTLLPVIVYTKKTHFKILITKTPNTPQSVNVLCTVYDFDHTCHHISVSKSKFLYS